MTSKFDVVATGGTFDEIHVGHIALLRKALELGSRVIIGVSSDQFAESRGKHLTNRYEKRVANLKSTIDREFGKVEYEIAKLDSDFGPAVTSGKVDALISSIETERKSESLNETRIRKGLKPVKVIAIELVRAEDGGLISSTRIRAGEIDRTGRILSSGRKAKQIF